MDMVGTSALVSGGSSGLGDAVVHALRAKGVAVVSLARGAVRGERAAAAAGASFVAGDVRDDDAVVRGLELAASLGELRWVVHCAGIGHTRRTVARDGKFSSAHPIEEFRQVLDANLVGAFNVARLAGTAIGRTAPDEAGQRGAIVLTSSLAATSGQVGQSAYVASKAGMVGMLRPLARDLSSIGVRVNAVSPGGIDTPMYGECGVSEDLRARISEATIFPPRMGRPKEFSSLAVELLANGYLNATAVDLAGGTRELPR